MLLSILAGGNIRDILISVLLTIPIILLSLSVHEAAHGYVAMKLGDMTAYNLGRITINPLKHLHPLGALCMLIFGYGWAKPVPINARNFKDPKKGMAFTAIAGPISNIILGVIGALLYTVTNLTVFTLLVYSVTIPAPVTVIISVIRLFFQYLSLMNFMLAAFNLIPVPPFDGSRFFSLFLPDKLYFSIMRYEKVTMIVILVGIMVLSRVFNISPFFWLAEKAFSAVYTPLYQLYIIILSFVV